jgi:homoserine kinase
MASQSVLVRVPATVGNFGGALDCAALALDAPLNVKVTPRLDGHAGIRYFGENGERVPRDRSNLVARAMEAALHLKELEFTGADLEIYSSVPVAVGLGSSTAAVLAGLIAADRLFRLDLDEKTLFDLAAIYESREDNLRAAWLGGFVTAVAGEAPRTHHRTVVPENFTLSVVVPETSLIPGPRHERHSCLVPRPGTDVHLSRAVALTEFFARPGNGKSACLDEPLPPTCEKDVPGLEDALRIQAPGVISVFICGSGPAVGVLAQGDSALAVAAVRDCFARRRVRSSASEFRPTNAGAHEWNAVRPEIALPARRVLCAARPKSNLALV